MTAAGSRSRRLMVLAALSVSACVVNPPRDSETYGLIVSEPSADRHAAIATTVEPPAGPGPGAEIQLPPAADEFVWERLKQNFQLPLPPPGRLDRHLRAYRDKPWALEALLEQSQPYIAWITHTTEQKNIPGEIALLPAVESGFDPLAQSHGGAAGLWQFIPATGRRFGLAQNWWYDGRQDIVASTRAALKYLDYLHKHFAGDWLLALAAYNSGEGKIRAAMQRNRRAGRPTDFWHLKLPKETQDYVPRLLALRLVVEHPDRYGVTLPGIDGQPALAIADTDGQIDLSVAAQLADMPLDSLYRLNPGYNRGSTPPMGPHRLVLPKDRLDAFQSRLENLPAEARIRWERHRIAPGETLSHIALRYNTTVTELRRANGLHDDRIRAGAHLIIPGSRFHRIAGNGDKPWLGNTKAGAKKVVHGVRPGDTLWGLARRYGVSVRQLATWNGISVKDYLRPGQKLVIWV